MVRYNTPATGRKTRFIVRTKNNTKGMRTSALNACYRVHCKRKSQFLPWHFETRLRKKLKSLRSCIGTAR